MDVAGATIAVIGRLGCMPRWRLAGELARHGGSLTHRVANAQGLVIGHGAHTRLGPLAVTLDNAERRGLWCLSEGRLLRELGLAGPLRSLRRSLGLDDLTRHSGLDRNALRLLAVFDIIEDQDGAFEFRDLVAARQVQRLIDSGLSLADIIGALMANQRRGRGDNFLARARLTLLADGELARAVGDYVAEMDGQLRLPLDDGDNPSIDLLFERAALAEEDQLTHEAEELYRRIIGIMPRDSVAHFNLANLLSAQQRVDEAEKYLERAIALDPGFAEAWYNLAHLLEAREDVAAARQCLERAVEIDDRFADAIYNLARLQLIAGERMLAAPLYERYLTLDPSSRWATRARQSLLLCRLSG